jgi:ribosome-binding protein aMBF1 (putative translation factor)
VKQQLSKEELAAELAAHEALVESWEACRHVVEKALRHGGHMPGVFKLLRQNVEKILKELKMPLDEQVTIRQLGIKL